MTTAEETLIKLIRSGEACPASTLAPLYDQLEPAPLEFMFGTWHGGLFDGGKNPDPIRWYGKRFTSRDKVDPMLCRNDQDEVYAWDKWGEARLREAAYGGKVQATLIYDTQPMMDYFRKVTDEIVLGLGDIKGRPVDFYFWLERDPA